MRKSYRALWLTPPSCRNLLHAAPDWERMMSSYALSKAVNELGLEWSPSEKPSHSRLSVGGEPDGTPVKNTRPPTSPKCTTSSQNFGARPIRLASAPLNQPHSHPLMALKREDTSICLLWMSPWPHISARLLDGRRGQHIHPSRAKPHLHSLDVPTQRLDRRLQRCTRWLCFRSFKPRCSQPTSRTASYATHPVLVETEGSSSGLAVVQ